MVRAQAQDVSPTSIRSRILKAFLQDLIPAFRWSFTHVDPFEDTESDVHDVGHAQLPRFTHVDPFEDTERPTRKQWHFWRRKVSPTSIRSRILKGQTKSAFRNPTALSFTHVDPFEDTERRARNRQGTPGPRFTHVDPFEDTERRQERPTWSLIAPGFTHVDPFEDTESSLAAGRLGERLEGFTHVDPFEDTERRLHGSGYRDTVTFHPRRSVRGY